MAGGDVATLCGCNRLGYCPECYRIGQGIDTSGVEVVFFARQAVTHYTGPRTAADPALCGAQYAQRRTGDHSERRDKFTRTFALADCPDCIAAVEA